METTNTNYRQLMLTDSGELTLEQKQFVDLHKRICYDSQKATEYIVDMAQGIREVKSANFVTPISAFAFTKPSGSFSITAM